ncbi:U11/U12 small nuclear ribonucleoprotein 35 kDa protein-like [Patiria miniata]|uniref:U11/U12 small nuclear ribonucleoprotein 35 kDa protein n=1 Tax=Patiria miniata TaxID=46514 RepID=A0A913ZN98_PATMI|nr:U11/U12 small nuclear ribonucleoprotein 35 kDa protein-like [Patiria miniata]
MESDVRWEPTLRVYCPLKAGSIDGTDSRPHDRAIERAMKAIYKPNKSVQGDPECTLFIGRLDPGTTEHALKKIFSKYGDIIYIRLVRDIVTGMSKRYAFVEYSKQRYASRARRDANHLAVDGSEILVEYECERVLAKWIPRRLGGGFGGKKESGQLRFGGSDRTFRRPIVLNKQDTGRGGPQDRPGNRHGGSHYDREGDRRRDRSRDTDRYHDRHRERDRHRDSDRYRDRDGDRYHDRREGRDRDTGRHRDRVRDRDRYSEKEGGTQGETHDQEVSIKMEHDTPVQTSEFIPTSVDSSAQPFVMNIKQEKL